MNKQCRCDYDPTYHRDFNKGRGIPGDECRNDPDPLTGICTPCLFGCAP